MPEPQCQEGAGATPLIEETPEAVRRGLQAEGPLRSLKLHPNRHQASGQPDTRHPSLPSQALSCGGAGPVGWGSRDPDWSREELAEAGMRAPGS